MKRLMILSLALTLGSASVVNAVETNTKPSWKQYANFCDKSFRSGFDCGAAAFFGTPGLLAGLIGQLGTEGALRAANGITKTVTGQPIVSENKKEQISKIGSGLGVAVGMMLPVFSPFAAVASFAAIAITAPCAAIASTAPLVSYGSIQNKNVLKQGYETHIQKMKARDLKNQYPKTNLAATSFGFATGITACLGASLYIYDILTNAQ